MPFALPIKADKLDNGFQVSSADCPGHVCSSTASLAQIAEDVIGHAHLQMSLLRIKEGRPMSVGDIIANVEQVDEKVGPVSLSIPDCHD